ncbi:pantoate--beta-alanine ligase [Schlesneria sp. T3-172]|uniref:pantoate--beta-alanine ligase n=1 Tax=Schlesneria sphaerica TaxID=3373610 RepID=UPI0037C5FCEF
MTSPDRTPPHIAETTADVRAAVIANQRAGKTIGFVPTMGALHPGHVSLMTRARQECDVVVTSIFVNPTQFGPNEDFQKYPRPRELDLKICGEAGCDIIFYPSVEVMYPAGFRTFVEVEGLSDILEGAIRPGHFRGVATVVTKLFMIVGADRAYFGQKDYQQQLIIRTMARELNIPTEVVTCPTLRDPDGMAMSSRNAYLSAEERQRGLCLSRALVAVSQSLAAGERDLSRLEATLIEQLSASSGVELDYGVIVDADTLAPLTSVASEMVALVAARVGTTRLIDNMLLKLPE